MSTVSIRIDKELFDAAAQDGKAEFRSAPQQINFWAKVGRNALANPDLPVDVVRDLGQFTRNYTQTVKRAADNTNGGMLPERAAYRLFCCPGFPKGCPLWHTTLLAKCSVLYLLAWLTGKTGCGASCAPFAPAGKQAEFLRMGMSKKSGCFQRTAAGI